MIFFSVDFFDKGSVAYVNYEVRFTLLVSNGSLICG